MYKLDQGIDHILLDEAQDTNPEQWRIIEALCEEFFQGLSAHDEVERTSFTVGDMKQSIYSFQRAAPDEFNRMRKVFDKKISNSGKTNRVMALDISFRSTAPILKLVDFVFQQPELRQALGGEEVRHISYRKGQSGRVELWPLFETEKAEKKDFWELPTTIKNKSDSSLELASHIAEKIDSWLREEKILPAYDRPIQAGDIMILVRTRTKIVDDLIRCLKQKSIAVSGADRMVLSRQIAIHDLLAAAKFCLLQSDDLNLSCLLKSPLIGWDDAKLFSLSYGRKGSIWSEIESFRPGKREKLLDDDKALDVQLSLIHI